MAVSGFPEDELRLDAQSVSRSVGEERSDSSIMQRLRKEEECHENRYTGVSAEQWSMTTLVITNYSPPLSNHRLCVQWFGATQDNEDSRLLTVKVCDWIVLKRAHYSLLVVKVTSIFEKMIFECTVDCHGTSCLRAWYNTNIAITEGHLLPREEFLLYEVQQRVNGVICEVPFPLRRSRWDVKFSLRLLNS
ncbi:hypothetical protein F2P79_002151 [Pimephales promelas]|nr:hypothetical protein F2P79_002151 [Pimephales promelas]